jgi:hypothetical protein
MASRAIRTNQIPVLILIDLKNRLIPVIPARGANAVGQLRISALRAALGNHCLGLVVGPPLPLPLFRCPLLGYCHDSISLFVQCSEGFPPGIELLRGALAAFLISIYTTTGAKPLAIFSTEGEGPVPKDQLLPYYLTQLQLHHPVGKDPNSILNLLRVFSRWNEKEVQLLIQRDRYRIQTTAALLGHLAKEMQPHQHFSAGERLSLTRYGKGRRKTEFRPLPTRIIRRNRRLDFESPLPLQARQGDRQHSRKR